MSIIDIAAMTGGPDDSAAVDRAELWYDRLDACGGHGGGLDGVEHGAAEHGVCLAGLVRRAVVTEFLSGVSRRG
ncbi:hypothetical protein [Dactylosporangium sp. NPDC006015]|uniref:hypothetical protein n=1 Tax=Dactylosporangium sp. NPDC006015 TaxID=3154576 RepID=UPI0033A9E6D6